MHYLIKAKPSFETRMKLAQSRQTPYLQHQLVWELMRQSDDHQRDFLWRWDDAELWILGANLPNSNQKFEAIQHTIFAPKVVVGQNLEFQVRCNPVIRIKDGDRRKKVDAVMHLKKHDRGDMTQDELNYFACKKWVDKKEGFGVLDGTLKVDAYQQVRFQRKSSKIQYSTVELSGLLRIDNVEKFEKALFEGLGSAKGFGCGLMLIKPTR